jgi:hypothetical protein
MHGGQGTAGAGQEQWGNENPGRQRSELSRGFHVFGFLILFGVDDSAYGERRR